MTTTTSSATNAHTSAVRVVTYTEGNAGIWGMTCADCPLAPHAKALDQPIPQCAGGIATRMQGPILLKSCKHRVGDFANNDAGEIVINCDKEPNP